jgi:hypothetical protein
MSNDTSEAEVIINEMRFSAVIRDKHFVPSVLLWDEADEDEDEDGLTLGEGFEESDLSRMILNSPVAALVRSYTHDDSTAYYTMTEVDISEERKTLWTLLKFEKVILPDGSSSHFGYGDMNFDEEVSGNDEFVFDALMSKNRPRWSSVSPDHIIEITEENFAVINSIFKNRAQHIFPSDSDNGGYYSVSEFTLDYLLLEMNGSLYYYGYDEYPEEANYYYGDDCSEKAKELTIEEILELIQVPSSFGVFTAAYNDGSDGRDYDDDDFEKLLDEFSEKMVSEDERYEQYARLYNLRTLTSLKKAIEDNREALGIVSELEDVGNKLDNKDYIGFVFKATGSLVELDDIFLKVSKDSSENWFLRDFHVYDFIQKFRQTYSSGEYDTGSLSGYKYGYGYDGYEIETIEVAKKLGIEIE